MTGKKPELIQRYAHSLTVTGYDKTSRVCDYIKYGWDVLLIDPDDGENV